MDGLIYVFGGKNPDGKLASLDIYNPETDSWSEGAPMPGTRVDFATIVFDGKIYAIGGDPLSGSSGSSSTKVEVYDPKTDTWETGTPMPTSKRNIHAELINGKIYVIGGNSELSSGIDVYDPQADTWETCAPIPQPIFYMASTSYGNKIYTFGGRQKVDAKTITIDKILVYDVQTDTWTEEKPLPRPLVALTANHLGNQILLCGGRTDSSVVSKTVYQYNPTNNTWTYGPDMTLPRGDHSCVVIDQTLYAIGGNGVAANSMEALELSTAPVPAKKKLAVLLNPEEAVQLSASDTLADNAAFTWTSSNEATATVDASGRVTAVAPGLAEITARSADGTFNQSIPVRVFPGVADLFRLAVHLTPAQTKNLTMTEDNENVTWRSLDEAVVTVDINGQITAVAPGLAIVQATAEDETQQIYVRVRD